MAVNLLVGTTQGVRVLNGERFPEPELNPGPPDVAFLAQGAEGAYALTRDGALWLRGATGWQMVASTTVPDEVWSFGADAGVPGRLYLGVSPAMLYRSDDGGRSWTACESMRAIPGYEGWTFPPPPHVPHVRSVAPDPAQAGAVYVGVEEGGVYRAEGQAETWQALNEGLYWDVHTVLPSPDPSQGWLLASTGRGVYRSDDAGSHWEIVSMGTERVYPVPLVVSPTNPRRVYTAAATAGPPPRWGAGAGAALFRSDDAGVTWQRLEQGLPARLERMVFALAADGEDGVYAASGGTLFASRDGGDHWTTVAEDLPEVRALLVV